MAFRLMENPLHGAAHAAGGEAAREHGDAGVHRNLKGHRGAAGQVSRRRPGLHLPTRRSRARPRPGSPVAAAGPSTSAAPARSLGADSDDGPTAICPAPVCVPMHTGPGPSRVAGRAPRLPARAGAGTAPAPGRINCLPASVWALQCRNGRNPSLRRRSAARVLVEHGLLCIARADCIRPRPRRSPKITGNAHSVTLLSRTVQALLDLSES